MKKMKNKSKQIAAWICIVLLVLLYVITFIVSLLDFPGSGALFQSCLIATIGLPILLWIYIWLYKKVIESRSSNSSVFVDSEDTDTNNPS